MTDLAAWNERFRSRAPQTREVIAAPPAEVASAQVRDPSAATQQLTYSSPNMRQIDAWDADSAIREAYLSSCIVFACITLRAKSLAGCPLRAVLPGQKIENHDPNAPLARLLGPAPGGPNATMAARMLWAWSVASKITTGKVAWELEKPKGVTGTDWAPTAIWPLVPKAFEAVPSKGGNQLFERFYYGRGGAGPWGQKVELKPEQVFYSYTPSLNDLRQPESPLQSVRYDIAVDVLQSVYNVAFLRNDSRPAGILIHQFFEDKAEARAFEQQFDSRHRGPANTNRIAFAEVEPGETEPTLKWVQMGLSARDARAIDLRQEAANRICIDLRTPMGLLDASNRTFSNASEEVRNWWLDTMLPDLADWADEINLKLAPRLGRHIAMFDTSHVASLQPPARFTSMSLTEAYDRQLISAPEARSELGLSGDLAAEGDTEGATMTEKAQLITALGSAGWDAQTIAEIVGVTPPTAVGPAPVTEPAPPTFSMTWAESLSLTRSLRQELTRAERRRARWHQADAVARGQEAAWTTAMRRLFKRQQETVLKRLEARKGRWAKRIETRADGEDPPVDPSDLFDPTFWEAETAAALTALYESLYAAAGAAAGSAVGWTFNVLDPAVQAQIEYRVSKLAETVTGTTYDAIRSVVLSGIQSGASIPDIAAGIQAVFDAADTQRATLIARTETIQASADGALASYKQARDAGLLENTGKEWIAELDERTDPVCEAMDGEVVGLDEQFSDGSDAPPQHPDCRCTIGAVPLDEADRSLSAESVRHLLRAVAAGQLTTQEMCA